MGLRAHVATVAALAAVLPAVALGAQASPSQTGTRLVAFRSCPDFLGYVKGQATRFVTPFGLGRPQTTVGGRLPPTAGAASQQGVDYSGTNVQEAGVDEPDLVKTNGSTLFALENGMLESVDVGQGRPRLLDTLKLDNGWSH